MQKYIFFTLQAVNLANAEGNTPLHWACVNGKTDAVRVLMRAGANASALNSHELTPVDEALTRGLQEIVDVINEFTGGSVKAAAEVDDVPDDAEEMGEGEGADTGADMLIDGSGDDENMNRHVENGKEEKP